MQIISNENNTGKVAAQWKRGIDASACQYAWIAEADDYCEPILNQELSGLASLHASLGLSVVYCQSYMTDSLGNVGATYHDYYAGIKGIYGELFNDEFVHGGSDFISNYLGVTNVIPNSSACLLARDKLVRLDWLELLEYRYSADWITYLRLAQLGTIAFTPMPLNYHRRHPLSVINHNLDKPVALYKEATRIQDEAMSLIADHSRLQTLKTSIDNWNQTAFQAVIKS